MKKIKTKKIIIKQKLMRCFMGASSASFMKDCCTQFARSWNQLAHDDN